VGPTGTRIAPKISSCSIAPNRLANGATEAERTQSPAALAPTGPGRQGRVTQPATEPIPPACHSRSLRGFPNSATRPGRRNKRATRNRLCPPESDMAGDHRSDVLLAHQPTLAPPWRCSAPSHAAAHLPGWQQCAWPGHRCAGHQRPHGASGRRAAAARPRRRRSRPGRARVSLRAACRKPLPGRFLISRLAAATTLAAASPCWPCTRPAELPNGHGPRR
jgi:hypothetical protein